MDSSPFRIPFCSKHNQQITFMNPDERDPNKKLCCNLCIEQQKQFIPIEKVMNSQIKQSQQFEIQHKDNLKLIDQIRQKLIDFHEGMIKQSQCAIDSVNSLKEQIKKEFDDFKTFLQSQIFKNREEIMVKKANLSGKYKQLGQEVNFFLKKEQLAINGLKQSLDALKQSVDALNTEFNTNNLCYSLLKESTVKQDEYCMALAFNQDASLVAAGCNQNIKIFEYKQEKLNQIQILEGHKGNVSLLQFMDKRSQLISGGNDNNIKIWQQNNSQLWCEACTLDKHTKWIDCVAVNSEQNLIVSGSDDGFLIFWKLLNIKSWKYDYSFKCEDCIYNVSFNESNSKLVSQDSNKICIFEKKENIWNCIQKIKTDQEGLRLCFISDSEFIFQANQFLELFHYTNQFEKKGELELKCEQKDYPFFPAQFVKPQDFSIVKSTHYLNVLKIKGKQFEVMQTIEFKTSSFFGSVSNDGTILIIWDSSSKEFQVRKLSQN